MILFPNAKINLGLQIVGKLSDGFHQINTILYPIPLEDILEIIPSNEVQFSSTGIEIPKSENGNLCLQAYHLLKQDFEIKPVHIHLHKVIPIGAGLGGGSADASYTLMGLNEMFKLNLSADELKNYARKLGSDCAFFIDNIPAYAIEKGDELTPIDLSLKDKYMIMVYPSIHISTAEAYANVQIQRANCDLKNINEFQDWKSTVINDFEAPIFKKHTVLQRIKNGLLEQGAFYAAMSGSGSTIFGIFDHEPSIKLSKFKHSIFKL